MGRENGAEAIEGYLQSKSVWINNGPGGGNPFIMKTVASSIRLLSSRPERQLRAGTQSHNRWVPDVR